MATLNELRAKFKELGQPTQGRWQYYNWDYANGDGPGAYCDITLPIPLTLPVDVASIPDYVDGWQREYLAKQGSVEATYFAYHAEADVLVMRHNGPWDIYYAPSTTAVISEWLGCPVEYSEQGRQENGDAELEFVDIECHPWS